MLPPLASVMLQAWLLAACMARVVGGTEEACQPGRYRSAPIVISCGGASGLAHALLPPKAQTLVAEIAAGVRYFRLLALSSSEVSAQLRDNASGVFVADKRTGVAANATSSVGSYAGVGVMFLETHNQESKEGVVGSEERLYLLGTLPTPMQLYFHNAGQDWAEVTLRYGYDGNERCPTSPIGCSVYNESVAHAAVAAWSEWAQGAFGASWKAWESLGAPHVDENSLNGGVRWYRWPAVFSQGDNIAAPDAWQPAFHFLDADGDGEVSKSEFELGFGLHGAGSIGWIQLVVALVLASVSAWFFCVFRSRKIARTVTSRTSEQSFLEGKVADDPDGLQDVPLGDDAGDSDFWDYYAWGAFWQRVPLLELCGIGIRQTPPGGDFRYGPIPAFDDTYPGAPLSHAPSFQAFTPHGGAHGSSFAVGAPKYVGTCVTHTTVQPSSPSLEGHNMSRSARRPVEVPVEPVQGRKAVAVEVVNNRGAGKSRGASVSSAAASDDLESNAGSIPPSELDGAVAESPRTATEPRMRQSP